MKKLRSRFERFCYRNRTKGIPNLMLYISIANAIVYLMTFVAQNYALYYALCFDRTLILQGQVWRLVTCVFTSILDYGGLIWVAISLMCYYSLGRAIENAWGTLRFNLFYFFGLFLMDTFAMIFGGMPITIQGISFTLPADYFSSMGYYLNLSLFIAYATLYPNTHFLLLFVIPVKAWIFALFDLALTLIGVLQLSVPYFLFPVNLFPLIALANYFLFFGSDVKNLFPVSWQANARRAFRKKSKKAAPFPGAGSYQASTTQVRAPYNHRCTVCGRTDVSNPELEFRYCSRCNGYFCYCEDHISNHTHVE